MRSSVYCIPIEKKHSCKRNSCSLLITILEKTNNLTRQNQNCHANRAIIHRRKCLYIGSFINASYFVYTEVKYDHLTNAMFQFDLKKLLFDSPFEAAKPENPNSLYEHDLPLGIIQKPYR